MDTASKLRALGILEPRIAELISESVEEISQSGTFGHLQDQEYFSDPPATTATLATLATTIEHSKNELLIWATAFVEGTINYEGELPLRFRERPLVRVQVFDVTGYARRQLQSLAYAKSMAACGGFGDWNADFWQMVVDDTFAALASLRTAVISEG